MKEKVERRRLWQKTYSQSAKGKARQTTEYAAWKNMRHRVTPNCRDHVNYFDRGITCCVRWDRFKNFLADMGLKPSPELTLERRDNNKGYSPDNCYWAPRDVQNENQRPRKDSRTKCTGVYLKKTTGKYGAFIHVEGKSKHLGYFSTLEEAVQVRKQAEINLYGRLRNTSQFSTTQKRPQGVATQLRKAA